MKKQKKFKHITRDERQDIDCHIKHGKGVTEIAELIGRSKSTISEEIRIGSVKGKYQWRKAQYKAYLRRRQSKYQGMKVRENEALERYVTEKMREDWSPEIIAGRIQNVDTHIAAIGKNAVYKYVKSVFGRKIEQHLWYKGKKYRVKASTQHEKLRDRTFIDERPESVANREYFGDWEGDFIVSNKGNSWVLLVLVERKSRYCIIRRVPTRNNVLINETIQEMVGGVLYLNSLTLDNDIAFKRHKDLSELVGTDVYFCHPYHSWEKGGVENMNKLIRRYIVKGSDIGSYSDTFIADLEEKLNHRPRKILQFKTPHEVMEENEQLRSVIKKVSYRNDTVLSKV